jgi:urate oxidase
MLSTARGQRSCPAAQSDMKVVSHHYGKARVRVLKVFRDGAQHDLREIEVCVMLDGDFDDSFARADNSLVVPTDTMKNTVNVLAKDKLGAEIERFGVTLAEHFLARYRQVSRATIRVVEHPWQRMTIDGQPHAHSFCEAGRARPYAQIVAARGGTTIESGIQDLLILKSTGSSFTGYPKDEFTTLPETKDRILATTMKATWCWSGVPTDYRAANARLLDAMLKSFALAHSPSVQATLYWMAEAALAAVPEVSQVSLVMPNQHCLLVNLAPFDRDNANELFVPTDEPHGQIEATISRS